MSEQRHGTSIEWTHGEGFKGETWNPVTGCSKVSPGCAHCYAEMLTARFAGRKGYIEEHRPWTPENAAHNVTLWPDRLELPLHWRSPRMVFTNSMSDLFHEQIPTAFIHRVLDVMDRCPQHVFQVLTKRPAEAQAVLNLYYDRPAPWGHSTDPPLANLWLGVSIENARYTWRADVLREIPAAVRFISAEPLLGSLFEEPRITRKLGWDDGDGDPIRSGHRPLDLTGIDWLIVGGDSGGRDARPLHPQWVRELRDACTGQVCCGRWTTECCGHPLRTGECCGDGVQACCQEPDREGPAFFFKQWGSWVPYEPDAEPNWIGQDGRVVDGHWLPPGLSEGEPCDAWVWPDPEAETIYRYAGAGPKSGGRELDGRTWDEMPDAAR